MDKSEFLKILRQSLADEVDNSIIEQSIKFYDEYISYNSDKSENEVIKEIGDPRLIAKTIIETEKASSRESSNRWHNDDNDSRSNTGKYTGNNDYANSSNRKVFRLKWYHMAIIIIVVLMLISVIIRLSWILMKLFFTFFIPIIFIVFLISMFRKR